MTVKLQGFLKHPVTHIVLSLVVSFAIMMVLFSQLYVHLNYSYIRFLDTEVTYYATFTLISNFLHGDYIQLWNPYDQISLAYYYLVGMLQIANLVTSLLYPFFARFSEDSARYFYMHHTIFYYGISSMVRTIGFYLIASLFTKRAGIHLLTTVLASTLLSTQYHLGLGVSSLYSLFPLLMFFIIRFVTFRKGFDFWLTFLTFTVAVALDPLVGLQYFYQGIHFLLLGCIAWFFIFKRQEIRNDLRAMKAYVLSWMFLKKALGVFVLCVLIMAPLFILLRVNYWDYAMAQEKSRFANVFTILGYFDRPTFHASPFLILPLSLNFSANHWLTQWLFVGWVCIFLCICGACLSKDNRKYIFLFCVFAFWLLQFPRDPYSPLSLAHWLNALTNPFNFTLRTFHMTGAFLLSSIIFPLIVLGADETWNRLQQQDVTHTRLSVILVCAVVALSMGFFLIYKIFKWEVGHISRDYMNIGYVLLGGVFVVSFMIATQIPRLGPTKWKAFWISGLAFLLASDFMGLHIYIKDAARQMVIKTHKVSGIPDEINPVGLDYQNPWILPLREHYTTEYIGQVEPYWATDPNNMQGLFFRYTNLGKLFVDPDQYKPRHKSYAPLANNISLQEYLKRDSRISYLAEMAVKYEPGGLDRILSSRLDRTVVMADMGNNIPLPILSDVLKNPPQIRISETTPWETISFRFSGGVKNKSNCNGMKIWQFSLPQDFPVDLASTVFTDDRRNIEVNINGITLVPAQGWLTRSFQYDLQNIHVGTLVVSLPSDWSENTDQEVVLRYRFTTPLNASSVWKNEPDHIGFTFNSPRDAWLVLHYPYDEKWRFKVNGQPQQHFRINGAFLGIPVKTGENRILLEYWPNSPVHWMIPISLSLVIITFFFIILAGFRSTMRHSIV